MIVGKEMGEKMRIDTLMQVYFPNGLGLWGEHNSRVNSRHRTPNSNEHISTIYPELTVKEIQDAVVKLRKENAINELNYKGMNVTSIKKVSFPVEHEHEWVFTTDDPDDTEISCVLCGIVSTETYADDYIEIPPKKVFMTKEELFWYRFCVLAGVVCVISWIVMIL